MFFWIKGCIYSLWSVFKRLDFFPLPSQTLDSRRTPVEALLPELLHCICGHYSLSVSFRCVSQIWSLWIPLQLQVDLWHKIKVLYKSQFDMSYYSICKHLHWTHLRYLHHMRIKNAEMQWGGPQDVTWAYKEVFLYDFCWLGNINSKNVTMATVHINRHKTSCSNHRHNDYQQTRYISSFSKHFIMRKKSQNNALLYYHHHLGCQYPLWENIRRINKY